MLLKSRFVVPVDAPVIKNGGVAVAQGRIEAVGPARELSAGPAVDFGDAVICPAFVNAHTHLELTDLAERLPPSPDFTEWLRRMLAARTTAPLTRERAYQCARMGIDQSLAAGVATVGDISRASKGTRAALAESAMRGVSFGEVIAIGTRRDMLAESLDAATDDHYASDKLTVGISPHAPYTVEPDAMRACADRARELNVPLCIHLAETAGEAAFVRCRSGEFAEHLRVVGVWDEHIPVSGCGPVELVAKNGILGPCTVIAHGNYVTDEDLEIIAASRASVAYCPRTHRAFGHEPHRFRDMRAHGINVCVGTDSLASNPSLSVLEELRYLRRAHADVSPATLMAMGTLHGARALGLAEVAGSITVGKPADLVVIPLDPTGPTGRWEAIFDSTLPPLEVYISGRPQGNA